MQREIVKAPIYQQVNEVLRGLIRDGDFEVGEQFLTERQICKRFDLSRATANKALSNLVAEGMLEFRKGIGTFVRGGVLDYDLGALVSFTEKAAAAGKTPSTRVLRLETIPVGEADGDISGSLRLESGDPVCSIERLRLADEVPVILECRYVVSKYCAGLSASDLTGSLYALWTGRYNLDVSGADQTIRAVPVRGREARLLQVPSRSAGLLVLSTGYLRGGIPLWWEKTLYRGDAYEFHNRLGPVRTARPAAGSLRDFGEGVDPDE